MSSATRVHAVRDRVIWLSAITACSTDAGAAAACALPDPCCAFTAHAAREDRLTSRGSRVCCHWQPYCLSLCAAPVVVCPSQQLSRLFDGKDVPVSVADMADAPPYEKPPPYSPYYDRESCYVIVRPVANKAPSDSEQRESGDASTSDAASTATTRSLPGSTTWAWLGTAVQHGLSS